MIAPLKPTNTELPDMILEHPGLHVLTPEYNSCIIGIDDLLERVIYDLNKMIDIIALDPDLTREDAWEHFYFNIQDCMPLDVKPIYVHTITHDDHANKEEKKSDNT